MRNILLVTTLIATIASAWSAEVRLLDLEPTDAQQIIEKQDQNLNYAPKIESSVPAVRFLGNEPHHVLEDIYLARQYHGQDGIGGYLYGYNVPDIAKTEKKKAGGDLRGAYNYIAGNGEEIKVEYWDDGSGFHQVDNLPKILPKQVDDAPDVKAAKEKFLTRWHEEAERNSHPASNPYNNEGQYVKGVGPLPALQYQQPIQYSQPAVQYQQGVQTQYQPQGQYRLQGQYQPQGHFQPKGYYQPAGQYQLQADQYSGQYSENQNVYDRPNLPTVQNPTSVDSGAYDKKYDDEETTGPPKGFFYSFDYPVGIIVNKDGGEGTLKQVYNENKAKYEAQLHSGLSTGPSFYHKSY